MSALVPPHEAAVAAATVVVGLGVASIYLYVANRLFERVVSPAAWLASVQLSLWWGGLGGTVVLGAVETAFALGGALPFPLALTFVIVDDLVTVVALWGLVGFLTYVYTGRYHLPEWGVVYGAFFVMAIYYTLAQAPYGVAFVSGAPAILYSVAPIKWLQGVIVLILIVPELVGAILYLSLLRRTRVQEQRARIWLVGGGILLWFALDIVVPSSSGGWLLVRNLLEIVPGLMSLIAFYPPVWAQRRFGLTTAVQRTEPTREASTPP
jgi:hypothetical protein